MIEILFRGKRKDNGEWVEGNYYESKISGCFILVSKIKKTRKKDGIIVGDTFDVYEINSETVGLYTGLTDKNGKKIFEGDILQYVYTDGTFLHLVVTFIEGSFQTIDDFGFSDLLSDNLCLELKIVGNIYDNPKLLEVKENEQIC